MKSTFEEIECTATWIFETENTGEETPYSLGTPVFVFTDEHTESGKRAIEMDDKDRLWVMCFRGSSPFGYGIVCGENRVLFRKFGSSQE